MKTAFLALSLAAAPLVALADSPDASFYKTAAEAGMAEVDEGNLAASKGDSQAVKDFGARMVKDHGAADDKLKSLAAAKGVDLPTSASMSQMATKAKLEVLSGDSFDKSYIKSQLKAHSQAVGLFKKESISGQDADAKAFAAQTLPTLRSHLKEIKAIAAEAGIAAHNKS